ncbi:MAG: diflavin flavoprotein [Cyanobacteria bacterium P01_D01_bin.73]
MVSTPQATSAVQPQDVQVAPIGVGTRALRSRTWDRLKFEIEYSRKKGTTANSYLIEGDCRALIDPPGERFTSLFLEALTERLDGNALDFIVLGHVNPNRAATLDKLLAQYPEACIICSKPAAESLRSLLADRFAQGGPNLPPEVKVIKGDEMTVDLGQGHCLEFLRIPTPRWPDGLATFDRASRILFSDKFYGAHVCGDQVLDEGWKIYEDDRRFFFDSLHAPQLRQVNAALDKMEEFEELDSIAPGHGPMVRYGRVELMKQYREWASKTANQGPLVALIYASAYGNTAAVGQAIASGITKGGATVELINCEHTSPADIKDAVEQCAGFIIGSPTLGGHAPTQIQTAVGIVIANAAKTKPAGVFGSFGWSGEAIDLLEQKVQDGGYKFAMNTIRVKFAPDAATLKSCEEAGTDFAQYLRRAEKRRTRRTKKRGDVSDRTSQAMGRVVGALCIVTAKRDDVETAMLASWVSQATFSPPGLTVAVAKERAVEALMSEGDDFVINVLPEDSALSRKFMRDYEPGEDRFKDLDTEMADNGCRIISGASAYMECKVAQRMECGDHWVTYAIAKQGNVLNSNALTALHHRKSGSHY